MAKESQVELSTGAIDGVEPTNPPGLAHPTDSKLIESTTSKQVQTDPRKRWKRRATLILSLLALLAAALILPPLANISRYQRQITALMTRSMGRPVRLSAVEMRLLPSPGFVLHDLAVGEDPAFGAEPILSARTVVASIRLFSLWRGRVEISQVSVDEGSLNLVRSAEGRWNLESLLMSAQPSVGGAGGSGGAGANGLANGLGLAKSSTHFPYLSATNSRVNFKSGAEKTPFSLAGTDLSFWQEDPGRWRVRLLGQPVRTDLPMSLADTGQVRMEASFQSASQLHEMPMKLQMEWRDAQLGQLSRLIFGSDAGWRGDVTADVEMQGTPEAADTKARLRATGVRREEFVPATSLDFDANCTFRYQHSQAAFHNIGCDTAIGDGRLHLKAEIPGQAIANGNAAATEALPEALLEVHQVPVQAILDLLRTVRSNFAPSISAKGMVNGSLRYKEAGMELADEALPKAVGLNTALTRSRKTGRRTAGKPDLSADLSSLQGKLTITGVELTGDKLGLPLKLPDIAFVPAELRQVAPMSTRLPAAASHSGRLVPATIMIQNRAKLVGLFTLPLASSGIPLVAPEGGLPAITQSASVQLLLDQHGYQAQITGTALVERLRDLAYGFGWQSWSSSSSSPSSSSSSSSPSSSVADGFHGGTADFAFSGQGAWVADANGDLSLPESGPGNIEVTAQSRPHPSAELTLHHADWQASYLSYPVKLAQATAQWSDSGLQFAGDFTYGPGQDSSKNLGEDAGNDSGKDESGKDGDRAPVKDAGKDVLRGNVAIVVAAGCVANDDGVRCLPSMQLHFGALDAATVEAALKPVQKEKSVFAPLTDRIHTTGSAKIPATLITLQADSLVLGPITLQKPVMHLRSRPIKLNELEIEDWEAGFLGGSAKGTGTVSWESGKPKYELEGSFSRLSSSAVAPLLDNGWTGGKTGVVDGDGKVSLSGLIPKDLGSSASGELHFEWRLGSIVSAGGMPTGEVRFNRWSGVAVVGSGKIQAGKNVLEVGRQSYTAEGSIPFGGPAKITLTPVDAGANGRKAPAERRK